MQQSCLFSVVVGAAPCQQKLYDMGLASTSACQLCGQPVGSYWHRFYTCPALHPICEHYGHHNSIARVRKRAADGDEEMQLLLTRGLYRDPRCEAPLPLQQLVISWEAMPASGYFEGTVYVDGSGLFPSDVRLCRCGFGVSQIQQDGTFSAGCYGVLPGMLQEVGASEILAATIALRHCLPPIVLITDYSGLVDGFAEGANSRTSARWKYADLWRAFWHVVLDIGVDNVRVVKVPAHVPYRRMREGSGDISWQDWHGNFQADRLAKLGAALHPDVSAVAARCKAMDSAIEQAARYIGWLTAVMFELGLKDCTERDAEQDLQKQSEERPVQSSSGSDESSASDLPLLVHATRACSVHGSHAMRDADPWRYCETCGHMSRGRKLPRQLAVPCFGRAVGMQSTRLRRLQRGDRPR